MFHKRMKYTYLCVCERERDRVRLFIVLATFRSLLFDRQYQAISECQLKRGILLKSSVFVSTKTFVFQVNTFHSTVHMLLQQVPPNTQEGSIKSERVRMVKGETRPAAEEDDNISEIIMPSDRKLFIYLY